MKDGLGLGSCDLVCQIGDLLNSRCRGAEAHLTFYASHCPVLPYREGQRDRDLTRVINELSAVTV